VPLTPTPEPRLTVQMPTTIDSLVLPTADDVRAAAGRLSGLATRTPVLTSRTLDALTGGTVFLKCESFQRGGAFKFRGAYNAVSQLTAEERALGVVAYSSGNHAQAVALTGRLLGVPVVVVMPQDAARAKIDGTRGYGAEVVLYDREGRSREEIAAELQQERGMTLIPPFDHPQVIAGQGTAALEMIEETGPLDVVMTPCGGGGLLSGTALAAKSASPGVRVIGVEPEVADDANRSFRSGELHAVHNPPTIADGLRTPSLGRYTFPLVRAHVDEMRTVSEREIVEAMRFLWTRMKLVVEPSGAVPVAALLGDPEAFRGRRVGIVTSGGTADLGAIGELFSQT
jgi:threo-3-hydroxy-L-aspartate ammonia-lyase